MIWLYGIALRARGVARAAYYRLPAESRPKPKVLAGALTGLVAWTLSKLAVPVNPILEGYLSVAAAAAVMWLVSDERKPDPADRAESPTVPDLAERLRVPDEGPVTAQE
jgi:hypothetical protein